MHTFQLMDRMPKAWRLVAHEIGLRNVLEAREDDMAPDEALEMYPRGPVARRTRRM